MDENGAEIMAKKKKFKLWKLSIIVGILLGIALKLYSFIITKKFICGIQKTVICNWVDFLKDTLTWVILTTIIVLIIVYGIKYLISYIKNFKMPEFEEEKESKKENKKKSEKKSEDEEIEEEPEKEEKPKKKKIKI